MKFKKTNILKRIIHRNKILFNFSKVINLIFYILLKPLFRVSKFIQLIYTKTTLMRHWDFKKKNEHFFMQEINFFSWIYEPGNVHFSISPSSARSYLNQNSKVLDIGCGDGLINYLFFSDIAMQVDAFDLSPKAIDFARKNYNKKNLNYINENILNYQLKNNYYNFVFWNDSINYFDLQEVKYLLKNIEKCLVENGILHIKSPIMFNNKLAETDKYRKFAPQANELLDLIKSKFEILYFKETDFIFRTDLNIIARVK